MKVSKLASKLVGASALSLSLTVLGLTAPPLATPASAQNAPRPDDSTTTVAGDIQFDWGWLGLLGLIGLAGLGGNKKQPEERHPGERHPGERHPGEPPLYRDPNNVENRPGYRE